LGKSWGEEVSFFKVTRFVKKPPALICIKLKANGQKAAQNLFLYSKTGFMSKCNFSIPFSGSPDQIFSKAKAAVEKQGGTFNGTADSGNFSINVFGNISGTYSVSGDQLNIVIEDKPMMIPCAAIESALKSQIG
jgi:hypothetical protein